MDLDTRVRQLSSSIATTRSFHLDNRNIDRRNDADTAEFTRTGQL